MKFKIGLILFSFVVLFSIGVFKNLTLFTSLVKNYSFNLPEKIYASTDSEVITLSSPKVDLPAKFSDLQYGFDVHPKLVLIPSTVDGWITKIEPLVANAPSFGVLHHGALVNINKTDALCPGIKEIIVASGAETPAVDLPNGFGYRIYPNTVFYLLTHFRNDTNISYKNVSFRYRLTIKKFSSAKQLQNVKPLILNVLPCNNDPSFSVPDAKNSHFSLPVPYTAKENGELVFLSGHFHDYASGLSLIKNNQKLWETKSLLKEGFITNIPSTSLLQPLVFKKGDQFNVGVDYNNPTNRPLDGMGIFIGYYHPL